LTLKSGFLSGIFVLIRIAANDTNNHGPFDFAQDKFHGLHGFKPPSNKAARPQRRPFVLPENWGEMWILRVLLFSNNVTKCGGVTEEENGTLASVNYWGIRG
jgi:hypothetical protein